MFVFLCIFAITISQAYALDATFDRDTGVVTISGTAAENEHLAIVIADAEMGDLDDATESSLEEYGIGFYEVNADDNGEYNISFVTERDDGVYNIFVSGIETFDEGTLQLQDLCSRFNGLINKVQVYELIDDLQEEYGGDEEIYEKYFDLKKTDSIDKKIFNEKPYNDLSEVYEVFEDAVDSYEPPKGGSGGGSGGGITIVAPVVTPPATEEPQKPVTSAQTFADVYPNYWGYEAIEGLYDMGIVNGVSSNEFAPDAPIKREEFVKMLVAVLGHDTDGKQDTFTDTDKNAWYSPYLAVAQDCGLAYGKEDGSFGIGEVLTRQDMAVLAVRVLGTAERGETVEFTDGDEISDYAKSSVEILCGLKVMNGVGNGSFAPKDTASRAQAAKVIYEIVNLIK